MFKSVSVLLRFMSSCMGWCCTYWTHTGFLHSPPSSAIRAPFSGARQAVEGAASCHVAGYLDGRSIFTLA